jgi:hypothetical protein
MRVKEVEVICHTSLTTPGEPVAERSRVTKLVFSGRYESWLDFRLDFPRNPLFGLQAVSWLRLATGALHPGRWSLVMLRRS